MVVFASTLAAARLPKRGKPIPRRRAKPRRGPVVDPKFRAFVRTFGCIACWLTLVQTVEWNSGCQKSPTECAHVGQRGLGQKCSDCESLPLCRDEHHQNGPESHHVLGKRFWSFHGLNRRVLIAELNRLYEESTALPEIFVSNQQKASKL